MPYADFAPFDGLQGSPATGAIFGGGSKSKNSFKNGGLLITCGESTRLAQPPRPLNKRLAGDQRRQAALSLLASGDGGRTAMPSSNRAFFTSPTVVSPKWKIEAASAAWA